MWTERFIFQLTLQLFLFLSESRAVSLTLGLIKTKTSIQLNNNNELSGGKMEKRIAVIAIVIDEPDSAQSVNTVLHENSAIIIGRMGLPYRERNISVIALSVDGTPDEISRLTGKLGQIDGVSVKAAISKK